MKSIFSIFVLLITFNLFAKGNPTVVMKTNKGEIHIELFEKKAPTTVKNFLGYVKDGFYNGTIFHRVIDGFMIQGGGYTTNLKKKTTKSPIKNEAFNLISNSAGTISMARTPDPHSATAQFFINVNNNDSLDYRGPQNMGYAVFGKVTKGMSVVNMIKKTATKRNGPFQNLPMENIVIEKVEKK